MYYDFLIVGNGSVGLVSALKLADRYPKKRIAVVGPRERFRSATLAAGGMHAVFCELEKGPDKCIKENWDFQIGLEAKDQMMKLFGKLDKSPLTARNTILYLKPNANEFEIKNYETIIGVAKNHKKLGTPHKALLAQIFQGEAVLSDIEASIIIDEFSFCARSFINQIERLLRGCSNVTFIDATVKVIEPDNPPKIFLNKSEYISGGKVILAAGAFSASLLPSEIGVIEMFQGVGSAILLKGPSTPSRISRDYVYRSPNRGGAQCGSHLVPTSDGNWYLGAGNYLAELDEYGHRLETIKYLMGNLSNEIFNLNETYQAKAEFVIGSRPRTLDGIPAIGPLDSCDDIFVAAGMNRIGLSISPWVAEQVCLWTDSKPISHILHTWKPDRTPISFNYFGDNVTEFCETRIANAQEHNLIGKDKKEIQAKRRELSDWALQANMQIVNSHNLPSEYCVHPDMLSLMLRRLETPLK